MTTRTALGTAARDAVISALPLRHLGAGIRAVYPRIEPELARLGEFVPRGGTALDVGAWFGPWSARLARYSDQVVSIEAHPMLATLLRESMPHLRVVHAAASDSAGEVELRVPNGNPAIGVSSVEHGEGEPVTVPRITIDGLELVDVRFIKLDVEGHELAALRGARQTIQRDRPVIMLELEERMQPVEPIVELLESWGYGGHVLPDRAWVPLRAFDLVAHQRAAVRRLNQSFVRRLVWPRPRYVNMVLFRPA